LIVGACCGAAGGFAAERLCCLASVLLERKVLDYERKSSEDEKR
jgi:uncharacterized protein YbcC (UPF0753/DUF2309 family)